MTKIKSVANNLGESDYLVDIIRLYELQLISSAGHYDLWEEGGRKQSVKALVDLFYGLTQIVQPKLFIEAGAKEATTSIKVRELVPEAQIFAFEAKPYNVKLYQEKHNYKKHNVNYLNLALTNTPGNITFNIRKSEQGTPLKRETGQSSILERSDESTTYEKVTVEGVALDGYFPEPETNCIWMDVEGATKQVLEGASDLLRRTKVAMIEVEDREIWKGQWLSTKVIEFMYLHELIPVARDFEFNGHNNIVFVNKKTFTNSVIRRNLEYFHSVLTKR